MELPARIHNHSELEINGMKWVPLTNLRQISRPTLVYDTSYSAKSVWEFRLVDEGRIEYKIVYRYNGSLSDDYGTRRMLVVDSFTSGQYRALIHGCVFA